MQIPQVPSYDEDQVALIVEDPSLFSQRCPIILGTPTIFWAVQAMKESKMHNLEPAWQYTKAGYEYMHFMMNLGNVPMEEGQSFPTNTGRNPIDLDEKLLLKKKQVLLLFLKYDGALQDSGNADVGVQAARNDSCPLPRR